MMKIINITGKIIFLLVATFCFIQCSDDEDVASGGGEIIFTDSLPMGTFDQKVTNISVVPAVRSLKISWDAPEDVSKLSHYLVEWKGDDADPTLYSEVANGSSLTIDHLYNDTYTIGVRAVSEEFLKSEVVNAVGTPTLDKTAPDDVANLKEAILSQSAIISWNNPQDEDFVYIIARCKKKGETEWLTEDTIYSLRSSWSILALTTLTEYTYSIQTSDYIGNLSEVTGEFKTKTEAKLKKLDADKKPNWDIFEFSSQESGRLAEHAIDGKDDTFWHTLWKSGDYGHGVTSGKLPQYIIIDLNKVVIPSSIAIYRKDKTLGGPTSVKLESCLDEPNEETKWNDLGITTGLPGGTENGALNVPAQALESARYLKLTVLTAARDVHAQIREIDVTALIDE